MKIRLLLLAFLMVTAASPVMSQASGVNSGKDSRPVVKNKPDPDWPKSIKKKSELTVVLRCVFASDAKVKNIHFIETRPANPDDYSTDEVNDLVKLTIDAAQKIKFVPAMKDGKSVSMWMELQYIFSDADANSSGSSEKKSKPQQ